LRKKHCDYVAILIFLCMVLLCFDVCAAGPTYGEVMSGALNKGKALLSEKFTEFVQTVITWLLGIGSLVLVRFFAWFESKNAGLKKLATWNNFKDICKDAYNEIEVTVKREMKVAAADGKITPAEAQECLKAATAIAFAQLKPSHIKTLTSAGITDVKKYIGGEIQDFHNRAIKPLYTKKLSSNTVEVK